MGNWTTEEEKKRERYSECDGGDAWLRDIEREKTGGDIEVQRGNKM